jgi:hypothetical protein
MLIVFYFKLWNNICISCSFVFLKEGVINEATEIYS